MRQLLHGYVRDSMPHQGSVVAHPHNHLIVLQDVYLDRETLKDRLEMVAEWMLRDHLIRQRELQTDLGQLIQALGDVSMAAPRAIDADS